MISGLRSVKYGGKKISTHLSWQIRCRQNIGTLPQFLGTSRTLTDDVMLSKWLWEQFFAWSSDQIWPCSGQKWLQLPQTRSYLTPTSAEIIPTWTQTPRWEENVSGARCKVISSDPHVSDRENETLLKSRSCGAWRACQWLWSLRLRANKRCAAGNLCAWQLSTRRDFD